MGEICYVDVVRILKIFARAADIQKLSAKRRQLQPISRSPRIAVEMLLIYSPAVEAFPRA